MVGAVSTESNVDPAQTPARLLAALVAYWAIGGLFAALTFEMSDLAISSDFVAVLVSGFLLVPAAVLLALKTAKYQGLKRTVQIIGVLAVAGLVGWSLSGGITSIGVAIICVSLPAAAFAAIWLGPEGDRRRSN